MRFFYLLPFLLLFFLASSCKKDKDPAPETSLFGIKWQATSTKLNEVGSYSYVYKTVDTLTPSFGREGFRIERNGTFVRYTFGPVDQAIDISGTWTSTDNQTFKVKPTDTNYKEFSLVIESVEDSVVQAYYIF